MNEQLPPSIAGAVDLSSLAQQRQPQEGDQQGQSSQLIIDVTEADFEQAVQLSTRVPVIVDLWADWSEPSKQLTPALEELIAEYAGRLVLAKIDADKNPQIAQAFQAQTVPTVIALIGGRPAPLFTGAVPKEQIRDVFEQVLQIAEQQGVTGTVPTEEQQQEEPAEKPLPPLHQEAFDALERGDLAAARDAYDRVLKENPGDDDAVAGLAQVGLLQRLEGKTLDDIRDAAAANPSDLDAQLAVADLDVSGGHVEDAFDRLLTAFPVAGDAKNSIRERLLELFLVVGHDDQRVIAARRRLTTLLF